MHHARGSGGGFWAAVAVCAAMVATSGQANAAATLVRRGSNTGTSSVTVSWQNLTGTAQSTTTGNLLVAMVQYNGSGSVTAPTGLGWTAVTATPGTNGTAVRVAMYYVAGSNHTSSHSSETFSVTGSTSMIVQLAEFSGVQASNPLDTPDGLGASALSGTSSSVSVSVTASAGPSLVIGAFANDGTKNNQDFGNPPTGYTNIVSGNISANSLSKALNFYKADIPSGALTVTATTGNKDSDMAGVVGVFLLPVTTYYWRGQGSYGARPVSPAIPDPATCYGYFDDGGCWSTTTGGTTGMTAPNSQDNAVFDGASSSTGACTISPYTAGTTQANQITVTSGYSGTITQSNNVQTTGAINIGGGTWTISSSSYRIDTNKTGTYTGDLNMAGGTLTCNSATVAIRTLIVSSGSFNLGSCPVTLNNGGGFTVSGGTLTQGTAAYTAATVTVSAGTLNLTDGTTNPDLTVTGAFTQSGGIVNLNAAQLTAGSAVAAGSTGFTMTGGTFNGNTGTLKVTGTSNNSGAETIINGSGAVFDGGTGTQQFAGPLTLTSGSMSLYTASMTSTRNGGGNANSDKLVTVNGGTLTLGSPAFTFNSTNTMTVAGTVTAGSGNVTFSGPVTLGGTVNAASGTTGNMTFNDTVALSGTFNTNASPSVTFSGVVTMSTGSAFNGGTGTTTFGVAPTLTAGTFTVGTSGSTGKVTMSAGATFAGGMTLAFPNNGGELATVSGQTISVAGTIQSAVTGATKPKIDCPACTGTQGFTMTFTSNATLNVDGLQFDRVSTAGVQIADMAAAKWIKFQNVKFTNNAAQATTSGTHLAITRTDSTIRVPGCYFDATAQTNVTLSGTTAAGVHFIFEDQGSTVNGPRAGEAFDLDADTSTVQDNIADTTTTPRFGSVVEWVSASPTDTAGTAVGFPTAAFDWNNFSYYGIYAAYKNVDGSNNDTLWKRNSDGSAAYSITFDDATYSNLIGTPRWDTINETTVPNASGGFGLDVNGDGDAADANVHVVYLATTGNGSSILPRIIKLIDSGSALARPSAGAWSSDFSSSTVKTITSPLIADATNLYFGGTDSANATRVFGVQITASSSNEKTLQKNVSAFSTVSAAPAWKTYSGNTFLFLGTAASGAGPTAYIYRMNVTSASPADANFTGSSADINDSIRLINDRAYAATEGGKVFCLDASNFGSGGFTNLSTFKAGAPYVAAAGAPMRAGPYIDPFTNNAYVGDNSGRLYVITSTGADLTGFPYRVSTTAQLSSSPIYLRGSGIIAIGASDGYVYFVNRNNGSNAAAVHKKYFVTSSGTVSTVAYNNNTSQYMVSSSDGKLVFIKASDVTDPDTTE